MELFNPSPSKQVIYEHRRLHESLCHSCSKKYIALTGRSFSTRYNEQLCATKTNNNISKYAQRILEIQHTHTTRQKHYESII